MAGKTKPVTKAVGNRRLLKLAEFLKTVPRRQFDMGVWVGDNWKGAKDLSCGTSACALGWATAMPMFQRLGLHLVRPKYGWVGTVRLGKTRLGPIEAAMRIFALDWSGAMGLFGGSGGQTPKKKAAEIEQFAAHRQAA